MSPAFPRAFSLALLILAAAGCARSESTEDASTSVHSAQAQLDRDRDAAIARREDGLVQAQTRGQAEAAADRAKAEAFQEGRQSDN